MMTQFLTRWFQVDNFLFMACNKHSYTLDQGLAVLCFHGHDLNKSLVALKSYAPKCVEWTDEDKILFEQAYMYHGKNFNKIKQVVRNVESLFGN